ncbi:MAG TPA: hypothetical protein VFA89_02405 [Terriglobales bacterium]|nr:hypothetical protein [Terriglobales bacterium]
MLLSSRRSFLSAVVVCLFAAFTPCWSQSPTPNRHKALAIGVDYADMIALGYENGYLYNAEKIRDLMKMIKQGAIDEVYWRVSAVGLVTYPSKVMTVMNGAGLTNKVFSPAGVIMRQCDPLAVAIEEAHKQGMKIYVYVTLFDFSFPGLENQFFAKHPEYWSRLGGVVADNVRPELPGSRDLAEFSKENSTGLIATSLTEAETTGIPAFVRGVPDYGFPEVRDYVLSEVKEIIGYKPDGVYFDVSRTHSGIYPVLAYGWYPQWTSPYLKYGYNEPEVALYRKLYGKNPPLRSVISLQDLEETPEERNWNAVRGSFLTEFIREASQLVHAAGMKVAVDFYPSTYNNFQPGAQTRQQLGRMKIDWKKWADERLVDVIRLNIDHRKHGYDDWVDASAETYKYAQDRGVKVYVDCAIDGVFDMLKKPPAPLPILKDKQPDLYYKIVHDVTQNIVNSSADGVFYYEAYEKDDALYRAIRTGAGR